ncbi:MAG: fibrillarin-like rRNA/tRNA 2'-O-methyltransferase [Nanoarchaeota archaeon]|nr:fibrillarin-like rRNA/tRNA 2'-O-methyltransferase [Nanoarchaeota archaeon]
MIPLFPGVWKHNKLLVTRNLVPGYRSLSEKLLTIGKQEYRVWDPNKSKPAAAIKKGLKTFPVAPGKTMLYLGIASGSTASYFSDIFGLDGTIYGVEVSERSIRDLTRLAEKRLNIVPILANAKKPQEYGWIEPVDLLFQDVATDDQAEIMIKNAEKFLAPGGTAMMVIKARSINVVKKPREVYAQEKKKLQRVFTIVEEVVLDPYEKDHLFLVLRLD